MTREVIDFLAENSVDFVPTMVYVGFCTRKFNPRDQNCCCGLDLIQNFGLDQINLILEER